MLFDYYQISSKTNKFSFFFILKDKNVFKLKIFKNNFFEVDRGILQPTAAEQQAIDRYMSPMPPHNTLMLSELPEPPIPLSEIGPIPPPPMFSSPSPTLLARQRQQQMPLSDCEDDGKWKKTS